MSLLCVPESRREQEEKEVWGTWCCSGLVFYHCVFFLTSVRRTQVIDDESDYFATDSNQWLSKQEREALQKREQELQELRHASRLAKKITIDFAGRQILEEDSGMAEYHSK